MLNDHVAYLRFTGPARIEKAVNSLIGLIEGISIDGAINEAEIVFLRSWLYENDAVRDRHPFTELIPAVEAAVLSGTFADDQRLDLLWLCENLRSAEYFDSVTVDMQRLHALLAGIISDGVISEEELRGLSEWLDAHDHLKMCWPYDEVESLVTGVLADGRVDEDEHASVKRFFSEFVAIADNRTVVNPSLAQGASVVGLCAVCPDIQLSGKKFCFTGASDRFPRAALAEKVARFGGTVTASVSSKLDYLVIGSDGNPCWAYACYGRKVELAVQLRKKGARIQLIHENDFLDAIADLGA